MRPTSVKRVFQNRSTARSTAATYTKHCTVLESMGSLSLSNPTDARLHDLSPVLAGELRAFAGKLRRHLREHGANHDFTPCRVSILLQRENVGSAAVSTLARAEGVRPQSMSAAVAVLLKAGPEGTPDPNDGRQTLMSLTPKCLKWLKEGRAAKQDWLTTAIARKLSMREQERLRKAMALLGGLVED